MSADRYEQALDDVRTALYQFAQTLGANAAAIIDSDDQDQVRNARALGEQGAAVDAYSLVTKMLLDYRAKSVAA